MPDIVLMRLQSNVLPTNVKFYLKMGNFKKGKISS